MAKIIFFYFFFFFKRECDAIKVFLTSNVRKNIKSFNHEVFKCLIDECNYCTYTIDLSLVFFSIYNPRLGEKRTYRLHSYLCVVLFFALCFYES